MRLWNGIVAAGYGNGQIRLYDAATGGLRAEVGAHARWIYALDLAPASGKVRRAAHGCVRSGGIGPPCHGLSAAPLQLLSGAEDSFVHVWKLSRNPDTDDVEVSARRERAAGIRERGAAGRCRRVAAVAAARGAAVERRPGPAWAAAAARLLLLLARPRVSTWGAERNGSWAVNRPAVASAAGPALPARRSERCVHSRART